MSAPRQRAYSDVSVTTHSGEGYAILLDGKGIRTPTGNLLVLPTREIADAVAGEWRAQDATIDPATMVLTKLANTGIDRIAPDRSEAVRQILGFGRSDLLCYRAETPVDLVERQGSIWNPLLEWAVTTYGIKLRCGAGLGYIEQSADAVKALEEVISRCSALELAAFHAAAALTGSAVIALALSAGHIDAEEAFSAAQLDEAYQAERWGRDEEAERRSRRKFEEIVVIAKLFGRLRGKGDGA